MKCNILVSTLLAAVFAVPAFGQSATDLYKARCASCHGMDGKGEAPAGKAMHARDFNSKEVKDESDDELYAIIKNGKNKMPGFAGKLSNDQIKAQIAYIRSLK